MAPTTLSASECRSLDLLGRLQSTLVTLVLGALGVAVLGTIVLCTTPPEEQSSTSTPLAAAPVNLNAGDPLHNACISALLAEMEPKGYLINGEQPIAEDRPAVLRGRQSLVPPDSTGHLEWRLQASLHPTFRAHSYLALRSPGENFSASIVNTIAHEWSERTSVLPLEVAETARELLSQALALHAEDFPTPSQASALPIKQSNDVTRRKLQQHGTNNTSIHYDLDLSRKVAGYVVAISLRDVQQINGRPVGNWVAIDFIRTPTP
jgi:hypothetical protein